MTFKLSSVFNRAVLFPMEHWKDQAWTEAMRLTTRHDIPTKVRVDGVEREAPDDVVDSEGRMQLTASGHIITGSLLQVDVQEGADSISPSPSVAWLFCLTPVVGLLAAGLFYLTQGTIFAILPVGLVLTYLALCMRILGGGWTFMTMLFGMAPFAGAAFLDHIPGGQAVKAIFGSGAVAVVTIILPAMLPLIYRRRLNSRRLMALKAQARKRFGRTGQYQFAHEQARVQQAINAIKDTSPQLVLGTAMGVLTKKWHGYAPDQGKQLILTAAALSRHFIVFGRSGTGKTSRFLRRIARMWLLSGWGGGLGLDGKGTLGQELHEMFPDRIQLVEPGHCNLGLMQNLPPEEAANALADLQGGKGGEGDSIWDKAGHKHVLEAAVLLRAAADLEARENAAIQATLEAEATAKREAGEAVAEEDTTLPERSWAYTYSGWQYLTDKLADDAFLFDQKGAEGEPDTIGFITWLRTGYAQGGSSALLEDALRYAESEFPKMDSKIKGSILFTALSWLAPVMSSPKVRAWADLEEGIAIEDALTGSFFALNVPEAKYGRAGRIVMALAKKRVCLGVKRRPHDWETNGSGHKFCLLMEDECQAIMTPGGDESILLPQARSLGLACAAGTQAVESLVAAVGKEQAAPLLDVFGSYAILRASHGTYEWAQQRLGLTERVSFGFQSLGHDYIATGRLQYSGPDYDRAHPEYEALRRMRRSTGLGIAGSAFDFVKAKGAAEAQADLEVSSGQWTKEYVATSEDMTNYLARPGVALINVLRGDVDRVDFCETMALFPQAKKPDQGKGDAVEEVGMPDPKDPEVMAAQAEMEKKPEFEVPEPAFEIPEIDDLEVRFGPEIARAFRERAATVAQEGLDRARDISSLDLSMDWAAHYRKPGEVPGMVEKVQML